MGTCDERAPAWPLFLRTMSHLVDVLDGEMRAERGLPLTWFDVLVHLADAPEGRMRMNDLSESVLLSKSGMTRLVDRLERAGFIARGACPTDRRVVYAIITAKGRNAFRRALPVAVRGVDEHFARHLTAAEERTLRVALDRILEAGESRRPRAPVRAS